MSNKKWINTVVHIFLLPSLFVGLVYYLFGGKDEEPSDGWMFASLGVSIIVWAFIIVGGLVWML